MLLDRIASHVCHAGGQLAVQQVLNPAARACAHQLHPPRAAPSPSPSHEFQPADSWRLTQVASGRFGSARVACCRVRRQMPLPMRVHPAAQTARGAAGAAKPSPLRVNAAAVRLVRRLADAALDRSLPRHARQGPACRARGTRRRAALSTCWSPRAASAAIATHEFQPADSWRLQQVLQRSRDALALSLLARVACDEGLGAGPAHPGVGLELRGWGKGSGWGWA